MKALSTFLAKHIVNEQDFDKDQYQEMLDWMENYIKQGIKLYQKHLKEDVPNTVQWAMIEKQLVVALEHMEDPTKSAKVRHETECSLCDSAGKPCSSCLEYHPKSSMCPPHEMRMRSGKNICPDCGREEGG